MAVTRNQVTFAPLCVARKHMAWQEADVNAGSTAL